MGERVFDLLFHLEVKTNNAKMSYSQEDTFFLVDQLLRRGVTSVDGKHLTLELKGPDGEQRLVKCFGTHVLRMSGNTPIDSRDMWWDDEPITLERLVEVFRFERNPDKPWETMDKSLRRHHAPEIDLNYPLFPSDSRAAS